MAWNSLLEAGMGLITAGETLDIASDLTEVAAHSSDKQKKTKEKEADVFHCDVCRIDCNAKASYDAHMRGIKHRKKVEQKAQAEGGSGPKPSVVLEGFFFPCQGQVLENVKAQIQDEMDKTHAILGLDEIFEIKDSSRKTVQYECLLCEMNTTGESSILQHVIGHKHYKRYIYKNARSLIPMVEEAGNRDEANKKANELECLRGLANKLSLTIRPGTVRVKYVAPETPIPSGKPDFRLPNVACCEEQLITMDDKFPVIGLDFVYEIHDEATGKYYYQCALCYARVQDNFNSLVSHVVGKEHRKAVLTKYNRDAVLKELACDPSKAMETVIFERMAREHEKKMGKGRVRLRLLRAGVSQAAMLDQLIAITEQRLKQPTMQHSKQPIKNFKPGISFTIKSNTAVATKPPGPTRYAPGSHEDSIIVDERSRERRDGKRWSRSRSRSRGRDRSRDRRRYSRSRSRSPRRSRDRRRYTRSRSRSRERTSHRSDAYSPSRPTGDTSTSPAHGPPSSRPMYGVATTNPLNHTQPPPAIPQLANYFSMPQPTSVVMSQVPQPQPQPQVPQVNSSLALLQSYSDISRHPPPAPQNNTSVFESMDNQKSLMDYRALLLDVIKIPIRNETDADLALLVSNTLSQAMMEFRKSNIMALTQEPMPAQTRQPEPPQMTNRQTPQLANQQTVAYFSSTTIPVARQNRALLPTTHATRPPPHLPVPQSSLDNATLKAVQELIGFRNTH